MVIVEGSAGPSAESSPAYGLWPLVLLNSAIFIIFAFSFFKPRSRRDWRTLGGFSAFIVALFVEMYGFPLTVYLLSGWLSRIVPALDPLSHASGHLWETILGMKGDPHLNPLHLLSNVFIFAGFVLLAASWRVLLQAQRAGKLATEGPYRHLRHPQYAGFLIIMIGFLLQWPTIPTLVMFPVLAVMYARLARREEREVAAALPEAWRRYAETTPRWFPRFRHGPSVRPPEPTTGPVGQARDSAPPRLSA